MRSLYRQLYFDQRDRARDRLDLYRLLNEGNTEIEALEGKVVGVAAPADGGDQAKRRDLFESVGVGPDAPVDLARDFRPGAAENTKSASVAAGMSPALFPRHRRHGIGSLLLLRLAAPPGDGL